MMLAEALVGRLGHVRGEAAKRAARAPLRPKNFMVPDVNVNKGLATKAGIDSLQLPDGRGNI